MTDLTTRTIRAALRGVLPLMLALAVTPYPAAGASMSASDLVDAMVAAHGGMDKWAGAPTISFEDEFKSGEATEGAASRVTVRQGSRQAYIDFPGTETQMSWDGAKAWSENWQGPFPPRFLALLNYHFLNLPWLAKDPGVHLGEPGTARLWDDPTEYHTVKITYGSEVGDTPDDYYVLYIHPQTHRLVANEYIVTYKALLPEGVTATPPKILVYDDFTTVDGLVVPTAFTVYQADKSVYASCEIRDWSFSRSFDDARMNMPRGAVIDASAP